MASQILTPSRRFNSRIESEGVWIFWWCNGFADASRVRDLSLGGLFVETARRAAVGSRAEVHFLVQEGQIHAEAVVRHVAPGSGLGLKITALNDRNRPHLMELMKRLRSLAR